MRDTHEMAAPPFAVTPRAVWFIFWTMLTSPCHFWIGWKIVETDSTHHQAMDTQ